MFKNAKQWYGILKYDVGCWMLWNAKESWKNAMIILKMPTASFYKEQKNARESLEISNAIENARLKGFSPWGPI